MAKTKRESNEAMVKTDPYTRLGAVLVFRMKLRGLVEYHDT